MIFSLVFCVRLSLDPLSFTSSACALSSPPPPSSSPSSSSFSSLSSFIVSKSLRHRRKGCEVRFTWHTTHERSMSRRFWMSLQYLASMKVIRVDRLTCRYSIYCHGEWLSGIASVWTNIYYMCLGKPSGPWRSPGLKFAPEAALRCQALPLSKRLSLWSGWVGQKRVSGWILRDGETGRDDGGNRRGNGLFILFSLLNLLVL